MPHTHIQHSPAPTWLPLYCTPTSLSHFQGCSSLGYKHKHINIVSRIRQSDVCLHLGTDTLTQPLPDWNLITVLALQTRLMHHSATGCLWTAWLSHLEPQKRFHGDVGESSESFGVLILTLPTKRKLKRCQNLTFVFSRKNLVWITAFFVFFNEFSQL